MRYRFLFLIVSMLSVFVFSQNTEENYTFYQEAIQQIKKDNGKSIKIYEYLINNATNPEHKINYQLDLIKLKIYVSKDVEAIDIFFAIQDEIESLKNREIEDKYNIIGADLAQYLGFNQYSQKLLKKVKSKDKKLIDSIHHKFLDLRTDLAVNSFPTSPIQSEIDAHTTIDSLNNTINEVEKFIF